MSKALALDTIRTWRRMGYRGKLVRRGRGNWAITFYANYTYPAVTCLGAGGRCTDDMLAMARLYGVI